jgi:hypothetical protein
VIVVVLLAIMEEIRQRKSPEKVAESCCPAAVKMTRGL